MATVKCIKVNISRRTLWVRLAEKIAASVYFGVWTLNSPKPTAENTTPVSCALQWRYSLAWSFIRCATGWRQWVAMSMWVVRHTVRGRRRLRGRVLGVGVVEFTGAVRRRVRRVAVLRLILQLVNANLRSLHAQQRRTPSSRQLPVFPGTA